ncbi:hypothetical protein MATL_G00222440 [Megalops atlanticus]|uniref:Uncharacterized protein n=1 Tax=Megalops atlanticus TaxID=7932 RepID=A0A9D3PF24_MEGAT|nr:hypothetical protein MATL_G00222440 [Megalops atlanticus]
MTLEHKPRTFSFSKTSEKKFSDIMKAFVLVCIFLVSAASGMMVFRHPFRPHGTRCFDEQGMFYRGRAFHDGYYVYKYLYVFPPGQYPKIDSPVFGHHYVVAENENDTDKGADHKNQNDSPNNSALKSKM